MQRLWLLELGWSDELPFKEEKEWRRFIDSLEAVNNISIDRCIVIFESSDCGRAFGRIRLLRFHAIHRESRELKTSC
ncbi:hypothetical protein TNCV_2317851 [Trichonephila clavipes]|nr:hypothetical protein TNCV_2317851 [Trichonephila clavipes]